MRYWPLALGVVSVEGRLPDPVARHWGASGAADGFSSLDETLWVTTGLVLIVASPLASVAVFARQPVLMRRFMAGTSAWLAVFVTVLVAIHSAVNSISKIPCSRLDRVLGSRSG